MIGIVLSGHGSFAEGMYSSLNLIAGEQSKFEIVDFVEDMSPERLYNKLKDSADRVETGSGVVIFTDIPGGTPFNQAVMLASENKNMHVIAGTNLPTLLDAIFKREFPFNDFTRSVLSSGKEGLVIFNDNVEE